jgi:Leucine-rich repeat (LRR) protein
MNSTCFLAPNVQIEVLGDLSTLHSLEFINLSFNEIQKLDPFSAMHDKRCNLKYLDLKGNQISDAKQVGYLSGCSVRLSDEK